MPRSILIAEDDRALCRSLVRTIEKLGYSVRGVHDGSTALEAVEESRPDLLILDLLLPKVDGLGVVRKLRMRERTQEIPVVAISGVYRGPSVARDLEGAGVSVFLEKPFSARDLASHLETLLGPAETEVPQTQESERCDLSRNPAPKILWAPMRDGLTGVLHFKRGKRQKELLLRDGTPTAVRSNLVKETLSRRLFDAGHIDERAYQEAQRRGRATGQPQGALLVKLGAISQPQMERALVDQAREKLLDLLCWTEGEAWFVQSAREVDRGTELEGWSPRRMMIEGAGRINPSVLESELAPYRACEVTVAADALEGENLCGATKALLGALNREKRVEALLRDHSASLYALWLVGALSFEGAGSEDAKPTPAAPTPAEPSSGPEQLEERKRQQAKQNHFEVLGLDPKASEADARNAFVGLAKRYHPDKVGTSSPEMQVLAAEVFSRISQAHEVLSNPERRRNYLKELKKGSSARADKDKVTRIVSAEQQFRKAEELVKRRQYPEAIEALRWALKLDPDEGEFHALLGWASFLAAPKDLTVKKEAIEHMQKATALAPNSPSGYYYTGKLYKACEDPDLAEKMFRKVLELRPEHTEANQELRLFQMRRSKGDRGGKSLFGRGTKK
ncbi:MAG: response regulator [Myxococcota bacterium]